MVENQTRLFGSLCLMTGSRDEAEEIAQEAFVRVLERWATCGVSTIQPAIYS
jgi:DNA-directed RNA polymerase specialized sigma24 family protein